MGNGLSFLPVSGLRRGRHLQAGAGAGWLDVDSGSPRKDTEGTMPGRALKVGSGTNLLRDLQEIPP